MSVDLVCSIDEVLPVGPKGSKPGQGGQDQRVALGVNGRVTSHDTLKYQNLLNFYTCESVICQ